MGAEELKGAVNIASEPLLSHKIVSPYPAYGHITITSDGGFAFVGSSGQYLAISKYDRMAKAEWQEVLTDSRYDFAWDLIQCSDGGFLVYGKGAFATRTTSNGKTVWRKKLGGDRKNEFRSAIETSDGDFLLFGFTTSFGVFGFHYYLVKFNSDGVMLWQKIYSGMDESKTICGVNGKYELQDSLKKDEHNYGIKILAGDEEQYILVGDTDKGINFLTVNLEGDVISSKLYGRLQLLNAFRNYDGSVIVWGSSCFSNSTSKTEPDFMSKMLKNGIENRYLLFSIGYESSPGPSSAILSVDRDGVFQWSVNWPGEPHGLIGYSDNDSQSFLILSHT